MKRAFILLLILSLLLVPFPVQAAEPAEIPGNESFKGSEYSPTDAPEITGRTGIVMDMDTGDILYAKDCYSKAEPASTTKLMTALLVVDHLSPSDETTVQGIALAGIDPDAVTIWLTAGETISVGDLLYALLLPSANDAANVLAMAASGTINNFVTEMNETAQALGCKKTHFANANGLPNPQHYTTAYDMALIARAAYSRSRIRDVIKTPAYWIPATNVSQERELWTTNYLLYDVTDVYYEACTGGKTGYTEEAGNCMVAFAEKYGRRLVSVVFGCPEKNDRYTDSIALLEFGFNSYHKIRPMEGYQLAEVPESDSPILDNYYARLPHSLPEYTVDTSITLYARNTVSADDILKTASYDTYPKDDTVGEVTLTYNGRELASIPIHSNREEIEQEIAALSSDTPMPPRTEAEKAPTRSEIFQETLKEYLPKVLIAVLLCFLLCIGTLLIIHFRRKRRVNVRRYFGDGPVPAVDPEAVAAAEARKKEREMLRKLEDSGESVPRPKAEPKEKHPTDDGIVDTGESTPKIKRPTDDDIIDTGESTPKKQKPKDETVDTDGSAGSGGDSAGRKSLQNKGETTMEDMDAIEDSGERKKKKDPATAKKRESSSSINDIIDEG